MILLVFWFLFILYAKGSSVDNSEAIKPCTDDSDCPNNRVCKHEVCSSPCLGACGSEAMCIVLKHKPYCFCKEDNDDCLSKKVFRECVPECEKNSICNTDIGYCECKAGFHGNPYKGCLKKCTTFSNCFSNETCVNGNCESPCKEDCGVNSLCVVRDHTSICNCPPGYIGNAFEICRPIGMTYHLTKSEICNQCGEHAKCSTTNGKTNCFCPRGYIGNPYTLCQKMCLSNTDCPADQICDSHLCTDPCNEACGVNTKCKVENRKPKCSCEEGFSGDPSRICKITLNTRYADAEEELNCHPKCGVNASCNTKHGICICNTGFIGNPYGACRKICRADSDCSDHAACFDGDCKDPCLNACGKNALCTVNKHTPNCRCPYGFSGNAFEVCREIAVTKPMIIEVNLCDSLVCGRGAECEEENCKCLPGHIGNPYTECYKKCKITSDCSNEDICVNGTCANACKDSCGINANCKSEKHKRMCSCPHKYKGDPLKICFPDTKGVLFNPSKVPCMKCICRAITGNDDIFACAEKSINFGYWAFAGEDLVGGEDFRTKNSTLDFITCMNNRICIFNTMNDYVTRALHRLNDIDCDGEITCADYFAAHKFGLTAKFSDSIFNASEARSFDQCDGHGEKDVSNNWTPKSCIGPSYVEILS